MYRADRRYHLLAIGKTGVGKSTFLKTLINQDITNGDGVALLDVHGDLAAEVVKRVPDWRREDLIHVDVRRPGSWFFNPLAGVAQSKQPLAAAGLVEVFRKIWGDASWGPRLEHVFRHVALTLLEVDRSTLADVPRLLLDEAFRRVTIDRLSSRGLQAFWRDEFEKMSPSMRTVASAPILNKVGAFLSHPVLRSILCEGASTFKMRDVMDSKKILIVNLAKGEIGEQPSSLLGSLLVSYIALAGLSRADTPEWVRRDFYVYLDEFHSFATLHLATMLSELRKYRVNLLLAHQYFGQLELSVRDAVLGNIGTLLSFRVGSRDAQLLKGELQSRFLSKDFVRLPNFHAYLRLMISGQTSVAFSACLFG
ncbi:MAG: type IV secretion system DNA-binding domain-containing protein [Acidobacteriota bacterium]